MAPPTAPAATADSLATPAERARKPLRARLRIGRAPATMPVHKSTVTPRKNALMLLREWHSRIGLLAFAFLFWLACTGVLLTRSNELGFDTTRIDWPWLMQMYGLSAEAPQSGYRAGGHWITNTIDYTLINGRPLATMIEAPVGVVAGGSAQSPLLFVASPSSLVLVTPQGERVDELSAPILPVSQVRRVGVLKNNPRIIAVQDLDAYQSSDDGNSWTPVSPTEVQWSQADMLSESERAALLDYAKPRIIVEQLLIDLHSGRLFGPIGAWAITLMGLITMILATTGVLMWWRIRKNRRRLTARPA